MIRWAVILLAYFPTLALANENLSASGKPLDATDWVSWGLSMVLVLIAIGICAWLAKKSRLTVYGQGQMKIVANLTLGTQERLLVVQVGTEQYLLGVTKQRIELLDKLAEPLQENQQQLGFAQQLNRMLKGHVR